MDQDADDGYTVDLVFLLDTTASMNPYIQSAKNSIVEICSFLRDSGRLRRYMGLQVGLIAYRDYPAETNGFVVKPHAFTYDPNVVESYLAPLKAWGGGDRPEAFSTALEYGFRRMTGWRDDSLKAFVVVTDAAPHGIKERDDYFPDGSPRGTVVEDPIKLAREMESQDYCIFTLVCEPTLGRTTEYAIDFYKALSDMTLGVFCPLTDPRFLASCIIGCLLEKIDLRSLGKAHQEEILNMILEEHLSIDQVVELLYEKFKSQNQEVTTMEIGDIYNNTPAAKYNHETFLKSNSLTDAIKLLKRVFSRRHDATCMKQIHENNNMAPKYGDPFSMVSVSFRNMGNDRISLKLFDEKPKQMAEFVVPNNLVLVRNFKVNVPVNLILTCGRMSKNYSRTFTREEDIDVHTVFHHSS